MSKNLSEKSETKITRDQIETIRDCYEILGSEGVKSFYSYQESKLLNETADKIHDILKFIRQ